MPAKLKTIHAKLIEARKTFHSTEIKKTGYNSFSKYYYFELADFLLPAMDILAEHDLIAITSFETELATMTITDTKSGDSMMITSPMSTATLKACQPVQSMGACQTFVRRYLYTTLFEIVEHDVIEEQTGKPEAPLKTDVDKVVKDIKTAKPADESDYAAINEFVGIKQIPPKTLAWVAVEDNWNNLTHSQALKVLKACRDYKKGDE